MTTDSIAAIAAVVVAAFAVLVSVWEGVANRRHNRLMVRPLLVMQYRDHPGHPLSLALQNVGLGPAVIESLQIFIDSEAGGVSGPYSTFDACGTLGLQHLRLCWTPDPADAMPAGMELPLIEFEDSLVDQECRRAQITRLRRAEFRLAYRSAYDERFNVTYRVTSRRYPLRSK